MSDTDLISELTGLAEVTCYKCGIKFGMPPHLLTQRREDYQGFGCPNGHWQAFREPPKTRDEEMQHLREQLSDAISARSKARDELAAERAAHEQTRSARRPLFRR